MVDLRRFVQLRFASVKPSAATLIRVAFISFESPQHKYHTKKKTTPVGWLSSWWT